MPPVLVDPDKVAEFRLGHLPGVETRWPALLTHARRRAVRG